MQCETYIQSSLALQYWNVITWRLFAFTFYFFFMVFNAFFFKTGITVMKGFYCVWWKKCKQIWHVICANALQFCHGAHCLLLWQFPYCFILVATTAWHAATISLDLSLFFMHTKKFTLKLAETLACPVNRGHSAGYKNYGFCLRTEIH